MPFNYKPPEIIVTCYHWNFNSFQIIVRFWNFYLLVLVLHKNSKCCSQFEEKNLFIQVDEFEFSINMQCSFAFEIFYVFIKMNILAKVSAPVSR